MTCLFLFLRLLFDLVETYRSPVETICTNIDYYIPDNKGDTKTFSDDAMARLRTYHHIPIPICLPFADAALMQ